MTELLKYDFETYFLICYRYAQSYVNAYGAEGYHNYMRNQDPTYDAFYAEGPSVDDKWRSTYPYVPTSYLHQQGWFFEVPKYQWIRIYLNIVKSKKNIFASFMFLDLQIVKATVVVRYNE